MGKNFYKDSHLSGGAHQIPLHLWLRYCNENLAFKKAILARLVGHNQLIEHMHAQASAGESVRQKDNPDEKLFSDSEMISAPQPIMSTARPSAVR
jgi:hypothetical protein